MHVIPEAGAPRRLETSRPRAWRRVATAATTVVALLAVAAPANAALSAVGPIDPATKFPTFYQDASGLQLTVCPAGTANCIVAPAAGAVPSTYGQYDARFLTAGPAHNGRVDVKTFVAGVFGLPGGAPPSVSPALSYG